MLQRRLRVASADRSALRVHSESWDICDRRHRFSSCKPLWPFLASDTYSIYKLENLHSESCPVRLIQCLPCSEIMQQWEMHSHQCVSNKRFLYVRNVHGVSANGGTCVCRNFRLGGDRRCEDGDCIGGAPKKNEISSKARAYGPTRTTSNAAANEFQRMRDASTREAAVHLDEQTQVEQGKDVSGPAYVADAEVAPVLLDAVPKKKRRLRTKKNVEQGEVMSITSTPHSMQLPVVGDQQHLKLRGLKPKRAGSNRLRSMMA